VFLGVLRRQLRVATFGDIERKAAHADELAVFVGDRILSRQVTAVASVERHGAELERDRALSGPHRTLMIVDLACDRRLAQILVTTAKGRLDGASQHLGRVAVDDQEAPVESRSQIGTGA
jgi:hypothetical protein